MRRAVQLGVATMVATASTVSILAGPAAAAPSSNEIVSSLDVTASTATAAAVVGDPQAVSTLSAPINGFPNTGSNYLVLSTGDAAALPGDPATFVSTDLPGAAAGADGNDLTQVTLTLAPPTSATCIMFDFAFLSEEYPEYVRQGFNDIFTAELNESLFSLEANQVVAPNNFAYDSQGNAVSIDTVFGMTEPTGTVMDGSTPALSAKSPVERKPDGSMDLFLSVQDLGDSVYDSAVVIDNLRWLSLSGPNCTEGATPIDPDPGVPDPGVPDPGVTGPGVPGPGDPDPGVPDPGVPDPGVPDPGVPDPGVPGPGDPDPGVADPGVPDPGVPGPGGPGPGDPDPADTDLAGSDNTTDGHRDRTYMATQLSSPIDVFDDPLQLLLSVLFVGLLVLVVAFPADLFNSTFENNREEINGWFSWIPRLPQLNLPSWVHLEIFGLVAAVLLLMAAVPEVGLDYVTLAQAVGFLIAILLVVVALETPRGWYYRRINRIQTQPSTQDQRREPQWRVLPSALIVAGFLALVSRLADFHPPYVYGLIAVYLGAELAPNNRAADGDKGRGTVIGMLCLFAVSVIAWFSWVPVDRVVEGGQRGFWWLVLDAALATFFILGLETAVFGMIPLTFLKGKDILQWRPMIWVAVFAPIAYVFINVQYAAPVVEVLTLAQIFKVVALFIAFGIFSFLFWGYFHPRVRRARRSFSSLVSR